MPSTYVNHTTSFNLHNCTCLNIQPGQTGRSQYCSQHQFQPVNSATAATNTTSTTHLLDSTQNLNNSGIYVNTISRSYLSDTEAAILRSTCPIDISGPHEEIFVNGY